MGDASDPAADGEQNLLFDQSTNGGVGSELISNTDFSTASGWNLDSNASISGGKLVLTGSSGISYVTLDLDDGHAYEVSFTVENLTSGTVKPYLNGTNGTVRSANGTYTEIVLAGSANTIVGVNPSGTMEIDNFSLKKIQNAGTITGATIQTEAPKAIYALAPVDNKFSLNFDGTNDHLVTQVDATAQPNNESRYYSFWAKASNTGASARMPIFSHGNGTTGAFFFHFSSSQPKLFMATNVSQNWVDNSAQDDGEWHHWTVKIKYNDITGCELWCDGVKQTKGTTTNSGSMNTYSSGITLGSTLASGHYFNGSIDEFSIHEDLDDEAIRALFNRGRPIDISRNHGAYDLSDKALHWWRMGDAPGGQIGHSGDVLFQGFSEEGSELIINGDFSSGDSDWTKGTGWSIANGVASCDGSNSSQSTIKTELVVPNGQNNVLYGKTFQLQFDILNYSAGTLAATLEGTGGLELQGLNSNGSYTAFCTTTSTNPRLNFNASAGFIGSIDNVSLKQVRGQYIGPDLITNGDYETGDLTGWTVDNAGGQTVEVAKNSLGSNALHIVSDGTFAQATQTITSLAAGTVAQLSFDYENLRVGGPQAVVNGVISSVTFAPGSGRYTQYFVSDGSDTIAIKRNGAPEFFVDNVSVREIGGAAVMTNMDPNTDLQTDTPY
tara:strand:- start:7529 stop:9526 length:1998 start_codon:yes stop_codon:yes gene_type:complete